MVVGNMVITHGARTVELRFNTGTGSAVFTYAEIAHLIETLRGVRRLDEPADLFAPLTQSERSRKLR